MSKSLLSDTIAKHTGQQGTIILASRNVRTGADVGEVEGNNDSNRAFCEMSCDCRRYEFVNRLKVGDLPMGRGVGCLRLDLQLRGFDLFKSLRKLLASHRVQYVDGAVFGEFLDAGEDGSEI